MSSDPPTLSALSGEVLRQSLEHGLDQASVDMENTDSDIDEIQEALVLVDEQEGSDSESSVAILVPETPHQNAPNCAASETAPSQDARSNVPSTSASVLQPCTPPSKNPIQTFVNSQDICTPMAYTTNGSLDIKTSQELNNLLREELNGGIKVSADWAHSLYPDVEDEKRIKEYLQTSGMYNNERWAIDTPRFEVDIYDHWLAIINSILKFFAIGGRREALDTHGVRLDHMTDPLDSDPARHGSSPDISVIAYGPSFLPPTGDKKVGFSNMASFFDGKLDGKMGNITEHLTQMGGYGRQMFAQQPSRIFTRGLVVSDEQARLFHFDRSGAQYTEPFNIHKKPETIVRLVLGLCSADEQVLGLDTSVRWASGVGGTRVRGTLRTVDADKQIVEHDLLGSPISSRSSICGRGTVCWPAKDRASGKSLLVKDYWMSEGRQLEVDLLKDIKGLPGVCQMVSNEEGRGETKDYRGDVESFPQDKFHNRIAVRIVLEVHGKTIDQFKSAKELLGALRDAIQAHEKLVAKGIIHRDLSHTNILIGPNSKAVGFRGILIDFDMAIKVGRPIVERLGDFRTGHPVFYSLMTWESFGMGVDRPAHDYIDDIEVFFWIFCFMIFMRKANGEKAEPKTIQNLILAWCLVHDPCTAYSVKSMFLQRTMNTNQVKMSLDKSWHSICEDLFLNFKDYVRKLQVRRESLRDNTMEPFLDGTVPNRFTPVLTDYKSHYTYILGLFDDALKKAGKGAKAPMASVATVPVPSPNRPRTYSLNIAPPGLSQLRSQLIRGSKRRSDDPESVLESSPTARAKRHKAPLDGLVTTFFEIPQSESTQLPASAPTSSNQV